VGDKYADLIQEAIDNLGLEFKDVKFVTPEDDPAATPVRHDGGLRRCRRGCGRRLRSPASTGTAPRN
jgi:hypothetical protein